MAKRSEKRFGEAVTLVAGIRRGFSKVLSEMVSIDDVCIPSEVELFAVALDEGLKFVLSS